MTSEDESLQGKISKWVVSQGYPLEMTVAHAFQKADFTVSLSEYYEDHEFLKPREIDVTVFRWSSFDAPVVLQFCCRIECKSSTKPWVVFVSEAQPENSFPFNIICSDVFMALLIDILPEPTILSAVK